MAGTHIESIDILNAFNLTPEARALLNQCEVVAGEREQLGFILCQNLVQRSFWESDIRAAHPELADHAREIEVSGDAMQAAINNLRDPICKAKRQFLNEYAAATINCDINSVISAYERRRQAEKDTPFVFTEADIAPFRLQMTQVFDIVFKKMKEGDEQAKQILKTMLSDFGNIPGADYRTWFGRRMAESLSNDIEIMAAKTMLKKSPELLDEMIRRFMSNSDAMGLLTTGKHE